MFIKLKPPSAVGAQVLGMKYHASTFTIEEDGTMLVPGFMTPELIKAGATMADPGAPVVADAREALLKAEEAELPIYINAHGYQTHYWQPMFLDLVTRLMKGDELHREAGAKLQEWDATVNGPRGAIHFRPPEEVRQMALDIFDGKLKSRA